MLNIEKQLKETFGNKLQTKVSLSLYTSTEVGGKADFLIECDSENELIDALKIIKKTNINYLIIGRGTNLLISDDPFEGLVIVNKVREIVKDAETIYASAGVQLFDLVTKAVENGLAGMEKLAGIPGSVGGALYGNAGAYGQSISDSVIRVKVFDGEKVFWVDKKDCQFAYRTSIFKTTKPIILGGEFGFKKEDSEIIKKQLKRPCRIGQKSILENFVVLDLFSKT
jgi:UDP-N-acetylmuramate dehydrogenase